MKIDRLETERRHDHAPDTDDVWAWIIIGLVAAGVILAIWSPTLKAMLQALVAGTARTPVLRARRGQCMKGCLGSVSGA
jgi:hypothetical protein